MLWQQLTSSLQTEGKGEEERESLALARARAGAKGLFFSKGRNMSHGLQLLHEASALLSKLLAAAGLVPRKGPRMWLCLVKHQQLFSFCSVTT